MFKKNDMFKIEKKHTSVVLETLFKKHLLETLQINTVFKIKHQLNHYESV